MYDHLLNDHPFFKNNNFSYWKVTFFQKDWVCSQRLHVFFLKETLCRCYCWLLQISPDHCYKLFLITATNYSCQKQRKKSTDETKKKKKIHTTSLKDTWTQLAQWIQAVLFLISLEGELIKDLVLMHLIEQISPISLAGSTLTTTWEKQW